MGTFGLKKRGWEWKDGGNNVLGNSPASRGLTITLAGRVNPPSGWGAVVQRMICSSSLKYGEAELCGVFALPCSVLHILLLWGGVGLGEGSRSQLELTPFSCLPASVAAAQGSCEKCGL